MSRGGHVHSKTWPAHRVERRARYIGEWLKTEARYLRVVTEARLGGTGKRRGSATLNGHWKPGSGFRRSPFDKSSPALPDPDTGPPRADGNSR